VEAKLKKYFSSEDIVVVTDTENDPQGLVAMLGESLESSCFTPPNAGEAQLATYMMPAKFIFVPMFLKNNSGKIDRRRMATTYLPLYRTQARDQD